MPSPEEIIIRIETHIPPDSRLTFHISEVAANDVQAALEGEGLEVSPLLEHSVPEFVQLALEVSSIVGTTLAGAVRALDKYWHRNDGKTIKITFNNAEVEFDGMSVDEVDELMKKKRSEWDDRWFEQDIGKPREPGE